MTIREIADQNRVTVQAVYKKLKQAGISLSSLKDSSGRLTEEGERQILELIQPAAPPQAASEELNKLKTEVEKLKTENNQLKTRVETLGKENELLREMMTSQVDMLTKENDRLHEDLKAAQAVSGMALQRIALPAPEHSTGFKSWFKAFKRGSKKGGDDGLEQK